MDTFEPEPEIDLAKEAAEVRAIDAKMGAVDKVIRTSVPSGTGVTSMMPAAPKLRFPEFKEFGNLATRAMRLRIVGRKGGGPAIYSVTIDRGLVRRDSLDGHMRPTLRRAEPARSTR